MKLWIDAQLSPALAPWVTREFGIEAVPVRDIGLRDAKDPEIFQRAREADAIVMTKGQRFRGAPGALGPTTEVVVDHLRQHLK